MRKSLEKSASLLERAIHSRNSRKNSQIFTEDPLSFTPIMSNLMKCEDTGDDSFEGTIDYMKGTGEFEDCGDSEI